MIENPELKIRILREMKGYTQENIAHELGISTKAYQKIESGETKLTISKLNSIAKIFGVHSLDILKFDDVVFFENMKANELDILDVKRSEYLAKSIPSIESALNENIASLKQEIEFLRKIISKKLDL